MFDISFLEVMLIAVVALLVLGPDKLPGAIRTLGLWIGRLKRSFNNIKSEIEREVGADEIRRQLRNEAIMEKIKNTQGQFTQSIQSVKKEADSVKDSLNIKKDLDSVADSLTGKSNAPDSSNTAENSSAAGSSNAGTASDNSTGLPTPNDSPDSSTTPASPASSATPARPQDSSDKSTS